MKQLCNCCLPIKKPKPLPPNRHSQSSEEIMENPSVSNVENVLQSKDDDVINIIRNHDFSGGLNSWNPNSCHAYVADPTNPEGPKELFSKLGGPFAVVTNRNETWQGLEQDITDQVSVGPTYNVSAKVTVSGDNSDVIATLKLEYFNGTTNFVFIGRKSVRKESWENLEGTFSLTNKPNRVVFYLEGPTPGFDILIKSVIVSTTNSKDHDKPDPSGDEENIILNPNFNDSLNNWSARGCKIILHDTTIDTKIVPIYGKYFVSATERTQTWNGIQQDITNRVQRKLAYQVTGMVRIFGNNVTNADVRATIWVQSADFREQYIGITSVKATDKDWVQLQGKFLLNGSPSKAVIYLEGPPPGTDILLNTLVVKHAPKPSPSNPPSTPLNIYGVNIIQNSNLTSGTNGWFPLGNCNLKVSNGSPHILPTNARESLGAHEPLTGSYILITNRTQTWMGPAQMLTERLKQYMTYQVSAWVRLDNYNESMGTQSVNVAFGVDGEWVNGGQVGISDDRWHEIGGSFRVEKLAGKVMVYVQGPSSGVDLGVAGLQIFPVNRNVRIKELKRKTDKIRKRDVILKFSGSDISPGTVIRVKQTQNSFPIGSCISRTNIDNEDFVDFFVKNFNWAVFANELKWYWTEPQQGKLNYKDADELLEFCNKHNIQVRGHCIFWEVKDTVQPWIQALDNKNLMLAVENRLNDLLTRYKGKFKHYDVNNEMMHGSFYQDRLGKEIRANMFKSAKLLDPDATLFVNDYHIEDGCDIKSSPERYIEHVLGLIEEGAPVGGIGVQGHIDRPVGPVVCSALDSLGVLGIPVWFTEVDVSSENEFIRADDLEVMLREAFAHPAVEGIILWGFWELFMSREDAHLVNAEGDVNEAGKRFLELKKEWLSHSHGHIDDLGEYKFRGFQGSYEVQIVGGLGKKIVKTFVVDKGEEVLVVNIEI